MEMFIRVNIIITLFLFLFLFISSWSIDLSPGNIAFYSMGQCQTYKMDFVGDYQDGQEWWGTVVVWKMDSVPGGWVQIFSDFMPIGYVQPEGQFVPKIEYTFVGANMRAMRFSSNFGNKELIENPEYCNWLPVVEN